MMPTIRALLLTSLPALLATGVATADPADDAVAYRQAVMNVFYWNTHEMGVMLKGEVQFDEAAFRSHADDLAAAASMDVLRGFPDDSVTDDSDARDDIWLDWNDFQAKLDALRTASKKLAETAASGDQDAMKAQFSETRKTCKGCHDAYKN